MQLAVSAIVAAKPVQRSTSKFVAAANQLILSVGLRAVDGISCITMYA